MKFIKYILYCLTIILISTSCKKDSTPSYIKLSESVFNIGSEATSISVTIECSDTWSLINDYQWCTPDKMSGENGETLTISVEANPGSVARTAKITVKNADSRQIIQITQQPATTEYKYELPVIFHVLYNDMSNKNQYIEPGRLPDILASCNQKYSTSGVNMNLEFTLASHDPEGNLLPEPGVNRIHWNTPIMDCEQFMNTMDPTTADIIWDPNQYINVIIFTYTNDDILGITHLPYATNAAPLAGLSNGDYYLNNPQPKYPHCVSINNTYIYEESTPWQYSNEDIISTLAHELGHYIGLLHAFSDNGCDGTDYCNDTPNYDRQKYDEWLLGLSGQHSLEYLATKTSCTGETFIAHNIMDYMYCYNDRFTDDQRARVRHVLEFSPMIPGPKSLQKTSGSKYAEMPPIRAIQ